MATTFTPDPSSSSSPAEPDPKSSFLSSKLSTGPLGLGDPDDRTLRKVELEVLIPKLVRERLQAGKCAAVKGDFDRCCLESGGMMMVMKCREQNRNYQDCMAHWFHNGAFVAQCKEEYLAKRAEFRRTGVKQNPRKNKMKNNDNQNSTEK